MAHARPVPLLVALLMTTLANSAGAQSTAQTASAPSAILIGQVIDATSGQGIPDAIVTLDRSTRVMTTSDGRFVFRNLYPGKYALSATKSGYLASEFGAQRPGGSSGDITIGASQRRRDVVIRLWRHAAITGTVIDEVGEPVIGVSVTALRRTTVGGRAKFLMEGYTTPTDDRGMYRIGRLVPGTYLVLMRAQHVTVPATVLQRAKARVLEAAFTQNPFGPMRFLHALMEIDGFIGESSFRTRQIGDHMQMMPPELPTPPPATTSSLLVYPTVYYPNATSMSAAVLVTVTSGQERSGLNLQISLVPTARVAGTISAPDGFAAYLPVRLIPGDSSGIDRDAITTMTDDNGRFTFVGVPAGDYTLRAAEVPSPMFFGGHFTMVDRAGGEIQGIVPQSPRMPDAAPPTRWTSMPLSVRDTDVTDLNVTLKDGFTISGQVEFEGSESPAADQIAEATIGIQSADDEMAHVHWTPAKLDKTGRFTTMKLPPGKYLLHVTEVPDRWSLKRGVAGDRDVAGGSIEIESRNVTNVVFTLTDRPATLSGNVRRTEDASRHGTIVVVFPTDADKWIEKDVVSRLIRKATVEENGHYEFLALIPGDYYVAAVPEDAADDWRDPALLQNVIGGAVHVQIGEGEHASRDVRLQEPR